MNHHDWTGWPDMGYFYKSAKIDGRPALAGHMQSLASSESRINLSSFEAGSPFVLSPGEKLASFYSHQPTDSWAGATPVDRCY